MKREGDDQCRIMAKQGGARLTVVFLILPVHAQGEGGVPLGSTTPYHTCSTATVGACLQPPLQ